MGIPIYLYIIIILCILTLTIPSSEKTTQSTDFYMGLCDVLSVLFLGLCLFAGIYKFMSFFSPSVKCESSSCK